MVAGSDTGSSARCSRLSQVDPALIRAYQSVLPVSKTLQVVANVMAASILPLLLDFSRRTAVRTKRKSGSTSPRPRLSFWIDLPLGPFLSQSPYPLVSIDVDHPDGQSELNHGNTHPKQAIPERISSGQHASNLQEDNGDLEGGAAKGNQHEPEDPAPMAHDPKDEQGDHGENADQKQRHRNRIAVSRRGRERERVGVDRWISDIHHKQAEGSEDEEGDHGHLQAPPNGMMRRCLH